MHCWEADDRVPGRPEMTDYRRRLRYHQAQWREANGHPDRFAADRAETRRRAGASGWKPSPARLRAETGANFLTAGALDAATARSSVPEPHQSFDHQRLWADLLWSPAMAFNLFGDLAAGSRARRPCRPRLVAGRPGTVCDVRFAHSPGRFDPAYLNSLRAFDAAFVLDLGDGTQGIVGLDTEYHERAKPETPKPSNLGAVSRGRREVGRLRGGATDAVKGRSDLAVMWLEHLLLLSMLQHSSGTWSWGRYVVVHPAGNSDFAEACTRYAGLLVERSTFASVTLEELLDSAVLPPQTAAALRERYILR